MADLGVAAQCSDENNGADYSSKTDDARHKDNEERRNGEDLFSFHGIWLTAKFRL